MREQYGQHIDRAITNVFEKLTLTKKVMNQLVDIVIHLWSKDNRRGLSGIVFAGFGTDEIFPSAISYEIDGVLLNQPILWIANSGSIDYESEALILGFAQADMIHLFIEGVTPQYEGFVEAYFEKIVAGLDQVVADALPDGQLTPQLQKALEGGRDDLIANLSRDLSCPIPKM